MNIPEIEDSKIPECDDSKEFMLTRITNITIAFVVVVMLVIGLII